MARGQGWAPGFRAQANGRRKAFPVKQLATAKAHTVEIVVGEFTTPDDEVARISNMGLTPECQEPNILLTLTKGDNRVALNLSAFRADEIAVLKEAIDYAFEVAAPSVLERDTVAKEAHANGDGTYRRLHRGTPAISYVRRKSGSDDPSLRLGPEDVSDGAGQAGD